jgi:Raf kinase inhibitor-like YbhB/YbcL family protein
MRKIIILLNIIIAIGWIGTLEGGYAMELRSPEFKNNEFIPKKFTCRGANINPELVISDIPQGTQSLALIFNDPDAASGDWVHWVIFDIPVASKIEQNSAPGKQGVNDFGEMSYGGPCPPSGTHRYVFRIYALDAMLNLEEGISKADLEKAMAMHILAKAELIGLFKK